jgi:hypothetical protein
MTNNTYPESNGSVNDRVEHCRRKADECERLAATTSDPKPRTSYIDMAKRWREMADRTDAIDRVVADLPNRDEATSALGAFAVYCRTSIVDTRPLFARELQT